MVKRIDFETLLKFGITILLSFKSTLLKTIPVFGFAGLIEI